MKRRAFIIGSIATIAAVNPAIAASYSSYNYSKMFDVVNAFHNFPVEENSKSIYTMFVVISDRAPGISIETQTVDASEKFQFDKIFYEDDITTLEYGSTRRMLNAIISGGNRVAVQCRRGRGNHFAQFSDHVLVWYQSKSTCIDSPAYRLGKNIAYNSKYKDYFVRVRCDDKLSEQDLKILEQMGYTKV